MNNKDLEKAWKFLENETGLTREELKKIFYEEGRALLKEILSAAERSLIHSPN